MKRNCPICGHDNDCASERSENAGECWYARVTIPVELLRKVPEPLVGVSCICAACVARFHDGRNGNSASLS